MSTSRTIVLRFGSSQRLRNSLLVVVATCRECRDKSDITFFANFQTDAVHGLLGRPRRSGDQREPLTCWESFERGSGA